MIKFLYLIPSYPYTALKQGIMQDLRSNVPWSISFRHGSPIPKLFAYSIGRNPTSSWSAAGRKRGTVHRDEKMVRNVNIATKMKMYSPVRKNLIKFVSKITKVNRFRCYVYCDDLLVVRIFIEIWCGSICKCLQGIQISVPKWIENGFLQPGNNSVMRWATKNWKGWLLLFWYF